MRWMGKYTCVSCDHMLGEFVDSIIKWYCANVSPSWLCDRVGEKLDIT